MHFGANFFRFCWWISLNTRNEISTNLFCNSLTLLYRYKANSLLKYQFRISPRSGSILIHLRRITIFLLKVGTTSKMCLYFLLTALSSSMRLLRNRIVTLSYLESRPIDWQMSGFWHQNLPITRNFQNPRCGSAYFATVSAFRNASLNKDTLM